MEIQHPAGFNRPFSQMIFWHIGWGYRCNKILTKGSETLLFSLVLLLFKVIWIGISTGWMDGWTVYRKCMLIGTLVRHISFHLLLIIKCAVR